MKSLFSLLLVALVSVAYATDPTAKLLKAQGPPQWDTLFYKNELSLDLGLPIGFLLTGSAPNGSLALSYQRALTKHDFLRISTRFHFQHTVSTTDNIYDSSYQSLYLASPANILIADSVLTQSTKAYGYNAPDIRFGYEHRFGKRRVQGILGLDVLLGAEFVSTSYEYRYFKAEPVYYANGATGISLNEVIRNPASATSKNINLKEGLAPMLGMFVHLSKRFSLRATMMYDIYWTQSVSFTSDSPMLTKPDNRFAIYAQSIIADLSLTVHF